MTNWFHRNPIKATSKINFDLGPIAKNVASRSICSDLAKKRASLIAYFGDPSIDYNTVLTTMNEYLPLIMGFIETPEGCNDSASFLRGLVTFKWSDSFKSKHDPPNCQEDAMFEVCSVLFTFAMWLTKHAAKVAAQENVTENEAKDAYISLLNAAGIFKLLKETYVLKLISTPAKETDLDSDALDAYLFQCRAEAQEITVARAIELKHTPNLICGLTNETASLYEKSSLALAPYNLKRVSKWRKYCDFKKECYKAYALVYFAEYLLGQEDAGSAIAVCKEAEKTYQAAVHAGREYAKSEGVGLSAKPAEHCFFRKLPLLIEMTTRKCERENGLLYHKKVPASAPVLNIKAEYGIAEPKLPELNFALDPRWKEAYPGFDRTKIVDAVAEREKKSKKKEKTDVDAPVEPSTEKPIFSTDKDPRNQSGCVIS